MISTSSTKIDEIDVPDEIETYVSMPSCLLQGCSNDLIIFRADGGNHFTHYGIYEGMFIIFDSSGKHKNTIEDDNKHIQLLVACKPNPVDLNTLNITNIINISLNTPKINEKAAIIINFVKDK